MKKTTTLTLVLTTICLSVFAQPNQELKVTNVCNLTERELNEAIKGHRPELAVEFAANTVLPISLFLKGDLVNFIESEGELGQIEVKQTFYVRCIGGEFVFSLDLSEWKSPLEFVTGKASIGVSTTDNGSSIFCGAELKKRH